jgi:hypothetical protein
VNKNNKPVRVAGWFLPAVSFLWLLFAAAQTVVSSIDFILFIF